MHPKQSQTEWQAHDREHPRLAGRPKGDTRNAAHAADRRRKHMRSDRLGGEADNPLRIGCAERSTGAIGELHRDFEPGRCFVSRRGRADQNGLADEGRHGIDGKLLHREQTSQDHRSAHVR